MEIILVNGKKRSGKDFFSKILKTELEKNNKTVEIMSFAEPMKDIIAKTMGITTDDLEMFKNSPELYKVELSNKAVQFSETDFRKILQLFGTEGMKSWFGDDVWVQLLMKRAKTAEQVGIDYVIIPDFRFLCENVGEACTVKIRNDLVDKLSTDTHPSETELNDFEFEYIINNSNEPNLVPQVQEFIKYLESVQLHRV